MSTRYRSFKGYKLHLGTTTEGIILSHVFMTANRHDAAVAPDVFSSLQGWRIELALGDAAYDSENVRKIAEDMGIFFVSPVNPRNQKSERKDAYGRVVPDFFKTGFGKWLLSLRANIQRVLN
ncbi:MULTISPECIES: transposase [Anoxybacillus]|uniref:transposase n=1 Tax=Anoxybacillus sp. ST70 TaxID=2864180 RepID=UPI001FCAA67C|nr:MULTISPECIES: transposase [Anoxybacillus]